MKAFRSSLFACLLDAWYIFYFVGIVTFFSNTPQNEAERLSFVEEFLLGRFGAAWFLVSLAAVLLFQFFTKESPRCRSLGSVLFVTPSTTKCEARFLRSVWGWQVLFFVGVTFLMALKATDFSVGEVFDTDGFNGAMRLFSGLLHPNFSVLPRALLNIGETLLIAFLATLLALPFALALCFFSAKNLVKSHLSFLVYVVLRAFLNLSRSIEALIWAIIFSVWVGIGPFAGMLALFVHSVASLTKQFSEIIESIAETPVEAIQSTGASRLQMLWFGVLPQVFLPFVSFVIYRWDINIRMATVIGLVGGGGIGAMLFEFQGRARWPEVGCIILVIALAVWLMDSASAMIRQALK